MDTMITEIEFEIRGIAPIKFDRWHGLPDPKTPEGYKKQAEEKVYKNEKGELSIPSAAIKAVIRDASGELGKRMESKKNKQKIKAGVFVEPVMVSLGVKKWDGMAEDIVARGMGTKLTRVVSYRPYLKEGWVAKGKLTILGVPPDFVQQAFQLGGLKYALLGHRPEFGRFEVTKFAPARHG